MFSILGSAELVMREGEEDSKQHGYLEDMIGVHWHYGTLGP